MDYKGLTPHAPMALTHGPVKALSPVPIRSSATPYLGTIREPFAGAWQKNKEITRESVLAYHAVFACISLISSDISKLRLKLVIQNNGIWQETTSNAFSPVLRRPNHYQNRIQFFEQWTISKLIAGNTYALKQRDARNVVVRLYVLDPRKVFPLVAEDGSVYYRLSVDPLSGVANDLIVPASEIIHDRMNCLFHPLVGLSPIFASGLTASQGLNIQTNSSGFFANGSRPGGVLSAPGAISDETAKRLKEYWEKNFSGDNTGRVAVVGDGLKYEPMSMSAVDSQLIEQLKLTAEIVCSTFHVPPYKIGQGNTPTYNNAEILNQIYYTDCLQKLIEDLELCLDEGLEMTEAGYGTEFDLDGLLRMDTASLYKANNDGVGGGWLAPNEARRRVNLPGVDGGESPVMQQQNYSLAALAKRDAGDPFNQAPPPAPATPPAADPAATTEPTEDVIDAKALAAAVQKRLQAQEMTRAEY